MSPVFFETSGRQTLREDISVLIVHVELDRKYCIWLNDITT